MITRYKNFAVFKAKPNENEKLPTHSMSTKIGEEFVTIGGCWTKEGANGKFLSAKLSDAWVDTKNNSKTRTGFSIVSDKDLDALEALITPKKERLIDPADGRDITPDENSPF